ncbi:MULTISPECIES: hypothetical protein [Symbiopectobacterium]|uniref:hypothetical protein n=1 Tax=Symbiopectobacterium TaxID=801 RepID=UPI001A2B17AE|nr:hypothetical protein [Candidatus Symbiopectobacterium endolongispinus]MBG6248489.1 hypothetical protein [Candidatus Symbiopectobacterium sp. PLON1]MBT9430793.1 hypothetical protein [Candidatus Symbiopectobacterium endolongispinus]
MGLGMPAWANPPAGSTGVDLTPLTNAVNFSTVSTGILAIAATLMTLYAAYAGVRFLLRMVKSA